MLKYLGEKIVKKIKKIRRLRGANELFATGKIFKAKDKELDKILKEYTSITNVENQGDVIRAFAVLAIKNSRRSESIQYLNIFLSALIIFLTIFSLQLSKEQRDYTELSTRSERIKQNMILRNALEYCKQNPTATESGLQSTEDAKSASCEDVLKNTGLNKFK